MRLSTKSRYGVRALFDMAYHSVGLPTQIKDISRRQFISPRYLEQIFQKLIKAKVIGSKRGPKGGYYLLKDPSEVTLAEVVKATEGPFELVFCASKAPRKKCPQAKDCVAKGMWMELSDQIEKFFDSITIADLCDRAKQAGVKREIEHPFTYHI